MYAPAVAAGGYGGICRRRPEPVEDGPEEATCHVRRRDPEAAPPSRPGCLPADTQVPLSASVRSSKMEKFSFFFSPRVCCHCFCPALPRRKMVTEAVSTPRPLLLPLVSRFPFGSGDPLKRCRFEAPRLEWTIADKSESDLVGEKR
jgi:hypothetical protein